MQGNNVSTKQIDDTIGNLTGRHATLDAIGNHLLERDGETKPVQWFRYFQPRFGDDWSAANPATEDQEFRTTEPELSSMFITTFTDKEPDGGETLDARCFYLGRWVIFDIDFGTKGYLPANREATPEEAAQAHQQARQAAINAAHELVGKLEAQGLDARCLRLYASGSKGFHVYVPLAAFVDDWWETLTVPEMRNLPAIFKRVAQDVNIHVDGLDLRIYNRHKGRMIRRPNIKRDSGKFKVPLTLDEFRTITPTLYDEYVTAPRPEPETVPTEMVAGLAEIWDRAATVATSYTPDAIITPTTPEKINRIRSMVDVVDPDHEGDDTPHSTRLKVIQAVRLELGYDAGYPLVESFANRSRSREFRDKEWKAMYKSSGNYGGKLVTVATLRSLADEACQREHGHKWVDPDPGQNPKIQAQIAGDVASPYYRPRMTDEGFAEHVAATYADRLRFVSELSAWAVFDGRSWVIEHGIVSAKQFAKTEMRAQQQEAIKLPADTDEQEATRKKAVNFYMGLEGNRKLELTVSKMASDPRLVTGVNLFDTHPYLLNLVNGTYDLERDEMRAHDAADYLTQRVQVERDPNATCPRWDQFIDEITLGNRELANYLQCITGICLSGDVSQQEAYFLWGDGSNGKSTFIDILRDLCGDYYKPLDVDVLVYSNKGSGPTTRLAALRGARAVATSELERGVQLKSGIYKSLTGGDALQVDDKHVKAFTLKPQCTILVPTNYLPTITESDDGTWRRCVILPFRAKFKGSQKDPYLLPKLRRELPGILNWAIEGFRRFRAGKMAVPLVVKEVTAKYRNAMNISGQFVEQCLVQDDVGRPDEGRVWLDDLYPVYEEFCKNEGLRRPLKKRLFKEDMEQHLPKQATHARKLIYLGWRIRLECIPELMLNRIVEAKRQEKSTIALAYSDPE
jgi:putative DNA primase/helicase